MIEKYDKLNKTYVTRYNYLSKMTDSLNNMAWVPHARMYLDSAYKIWQRVPAEIKLTDYSEIEPFVTTFRKAMDDIAAGLNQDNQTVHRILRGVIDDELEYAAG